MIGLALGAYTASAGEATVISVDKIWDTAPHSAFTDLTRHQGQWFCAFREGEGHVPVANPEKPGNGVIRIITSKNGRTWTSVAVLAEETIDLRDPHFSTMPDGRLMLIIGGSLYKGERYFTRQPRVSFSTDGLTWSSPQPIMQDGDWLWRVLWHEGQAYGINKRVPGQNNPRIPKRGILVTSRNGVDWSTVTELEVPGIDEATVIVGENDEMFMIARREIGEKNAWMGRSLPPYTKWTWQDCGTPVGGPNLVQIPRHGLWLGGRGFPDRKTVLGEMQDGRFVRRLTFPSGGDNSYPGFVWHDDILWMSYYSSHDGKASVYLARVGIERSGESRSSEPQSRNDGVQRGSQSSPSRIASSGY